MFCLFEGWDFETSMYFTFVTLTTVGLGDFFPETSGGQILLVIFAMVGLGLVATLLTLIEQLLSDMSKHRKLVLEKARQAAVKARGGGNVASVLKSSARRIVVAGTAFGKKGQDKEEEGSGTASSEITVLTTQ